MITRPRPSSEYCHRPPAPAAAVSIPWTTQWLRAATRTSQGRQHVQGVMQVSSCSVSRSRTAAEETVECSRDLHDHCSKLFLSRRGFQQQLLHWRFGPYYTVAVSYCCSCCCCCFHCCCCRGASLFGPGEPLTPSLLQVPRYRATSPVLALTF